MKAILNPAPISETIDEEIILIHTEEIVTQLEELTQESSELNETVDECDSNYTIDWCSCCQEWSSFGICSCSFYPPLDIYEAEEKIFILEDRSIGGLWHEIFPMVIDSHGNYIICCMDGWKYFAVTSGDSEPNSADSKP